MTEWESGIEFEETEESVEDLAEDYGISTASIAPDGSTYTFLFSSTWSGSYTYISYSSSGAGPYYYTSSYSIPTSTTSALSSSVATLYTSPFYTFGFSSVSLSVPSSSLTVRANCSYPAGDYSLGGTLQSYLMFGTSISNNAKRYPTSVTIIMGSQSIGTYSISSGQIIGLPEKITLSSSVSSVSYVFNYSSGSYSPSPSGTRFSLYCYFNDGIELVEIKDDPYISYFASIISWLRSTNSFVANGFASVLSALNDLGLGAGLSAVVSAVQSVKDTLTSSPQQDSASNDFKDEMQETLDKIDEANQTIEDNTNRPTMEELRPPDVSTIVDASDPGYAAAMEGIGSFLAADFMVNILLLMCTMAFCGYVLFGKKG